MKAIWQRLQVIWQNLNKEQQISVVISIVISIALSFLTFNFGQNRQLVVNSIKDAAGVGGVCGPAFYDSFGNQRSVSPTGLTEFDIQGPIYVIAPAVIVPLSRPSQPCPIYPEIISPTLAIQGSPLYPLYFDVSIPERLISPGGSFQIDTSISITNTFSSKGLYYAIPFSDTMKRDVKLELQTTTFDFTPENTQALTQELSFSNSPQETWVLSPKEGVTGQQTMIVNLKGVGYKRALITLDVRPLTGIDPRLAAVITAIVSFIVFTMGVVKHVLEVKKLAKDTNADDSKKEAKGNSRRNKRNSKK